MTGVLFPGQGSQHVGMGKFLFDEFKQAQQIFEEASDTLSIDFKKLCFFGDEKDLALTFNTQPALLTTSIATYKVLQETVGIKPSAGAGHSVGEYAAAVASGVISFKDGVSLVRKRGTFMQEAVPVGKGGMLAVMGLSEGQVQEMCTWAENESGLKPLEPANFNSPEQIVVSGNAELVSWTQQNFKPEKIGLAGKKVRLIPLKVSAPFHCSMMQNAQDAMEKELAKVEFKNGAWPIAQNVDGKTHTDGSMIRNNLVAQITGSVKWTHCVKTLRDMGVTTMIECGAGKVLTGLLKKIDSEAYPAFNLNSLEDLKTVEKELKL